MKRVSSFALPALLVALASPVAASPRPTLGPAPAWQAPVPVEARTPSGLDVVVLPHHELPLVHLFVTVRAGSALDAAGPSPRPGLASAVAMMLSDGGAGSRSAPALAEAFEALGDELKVDVDQDGVRMQLSVLSSHLPAALDLLGDMLARPRFDPAEWPRARARRVAEIIKQQNDPRKIADLVFLRALYGTGHPYGLPVLGTERALLALTVDDLRAFYKERYGPRTTAIVLAGDVAPERARDLVEKAFAGWTSSAEPPHAPPAPSALAVPAPSVRLLLVDRPGAPQSELRVGRLGLARATSDYAAAELLGMALGGSFTSRLVQNLRERHGYTYGVAARFQYLDGPGPFFVKTAVRTEATAPALTEIVGELSRIRAPLGDGELGKARALVESGLVEDFSDGRDAVNLLGDLAIHGLPLDTWTRLPAALARQSAAALATVAARLFVPDALTIVVVGDRRIIEPSLRELPFVKSLRVEDVDGKSP